MDALARRLREEGAQILENCEVADLRSGSGGWTISTNTEAAVHAEKVVVAAGLPSVRLLGRFGVRVPMQPARGYSVTIAGNGTPPRHALYLAEAKIGMSPYSDGVRLAGVFELGAARAEAPPGAGERLLAAARPYLSGMAPGRGRAGRDLGGTSSGDRGRPPADRSVARAPWALRRLGARDARHHARTGDRRAARPAGARRPHGARARALRAGTPLMQIRAAVLEATGGPLTVSDLELAAPGPEEVLVRLGASGVCHSDWNAVDGTSETPCPAVLGHEGAGVVEAVGAGVEPGPRPEITSRSPGRRRAAGAVNARATSRGSARPPGRRWRQVA